MTNRRVGPRVLSQTKMSVQQCVLYEKVPATVHLDYSVTAERQKYASILRGRMDNLAEAFKSYEFLSELLSCDAAFKTTEGSRYAAAINNFFKGVISLETGMGGDITEAEVLSYISSVKPLISIKEILDRWYPAKGDISNCMNAIQVNRFIEKKRNEIKEACSYLRFRKIKDDINEMLHLLNRTRYGVVAKVRNHQLVVDFPDWMRPLTAKSMYSSCVLRYFERGRGLLIKMTLYCLSMRFSITLTMPICLSPSTSCWR